MIMIEPDKLVIPHMVADSQQGWRVTTPAPRSDWEEIMAADPLALVDQSPQWQEFICAASSFRDDSRLYELADGQRLLFPVVRQRGLPPGLALRASPPASWGIGGLLSYRPIEARHIHIVLEDLARLPGLRTIIRPNPLMGSLWAAARPKGITIIPRMAHVLDLHAGFDQVWSHAFLSGTRQNVRRAEKSGLVVECDTTGKLVPVFYDLFMQSIDRWAEKQHEPPGLARWRAAQRDPLAKFKMMAKLLGNKCRIWVAWKDGQPAASILVLQDTNAHYTRGAMNKELAGPTRANDLLQKLAIEDACRSGCGYYHMGETGASTSLARYKANFGAVAVPYAEYAIERLPLTQTDYRLRNLVKRIIGFKDV